MTPDNTIRQELRNLAPTLADYRIEMPYGVPAGYFEQLPDAVIAAIQAVEQPAVPVGYFAALPGLVMSRIREEAAEQASEIENSDPILSETLETLRHQMPYTVPAGYFGELGTLSRLPGAKKMPQAVPANYFEQLPQQVMASVDNDAPSRAKLITMRRSPARWLSLAAAAVLVGVISISLYRYLDGPSNPNSTSTSTVLAQSKHLDSAIVVGTQMTDDAFEQSLKTLSTVDVISYLEKTSSETDMAYLASEVDESKLPNGDQLLLDDQALNQFVQELETTNSTPE